MKKGAKTIAYLILIILGTFLILDASTTITGHAVSDELGKTGGILMGLSFFIGGILLFLFEKRKERYQIQVDSVLDKYQNKKYSPVKTIETLNRLSSGPVSGATYIGEGKGLIKTSKGQRARFELSDKKAKNLLLAAYQSAIINNPKNKSNFKGKSIEKIIKDIEPSKK